MTHRILLVVVGVAFGLSAMPAQADHGTIEGKKLLIKVLPSGNKIIARGGSYVDTDIDTSDPRCEAPGGGGGVLTVDGGGGNAFSIVLPCENWSAAGGSEFHPDYRYKDPSQATCTLIQLRYEKKFKAICKGPQVDYLLGTAQGDIAVTLELGSAPRRNCLVFGPIPTKVSKDGSDGRTYLAKKAPRPATCP